MARVAGGADRAPARLRGGVSAWDADTWVRPLDAVYAVGRWRHVAVQCIGHRYRECESPASPARFVSGALGLFIGVAAFAMLLAMQLAFQGQVVGTALGDLVSVQVRGVDLVAAVLALLLGAFSVADVLAVNLRDRAGEQAVLAATGWRPATLFRLAFTEGMVVGIVRGSCRRRGGAGLGHPAHRFGTRRCSRRDTGCCDRAYPRRWSAHVPLLAGLARPAPAAALAED